MGSLKPVPESIIVGSGAGFDIIIVNGMLHHSATQNELKGIVFLMVYLVWRLATKREMGLDPSSAWYYGLSLFYVGVSKQQHDNLNIFLAKILPGLKQTYKQSP